MRRIARRIPKRLKSVSNPQHGVNQMAKFTLSVDADNAAFEPNWRMEMTSILREVIARIDSGENIRQGAAIRDSNGNHVGQFRMTGRT
jgi:hypothetical protein